MNVIQRLLMGEEPTDTHTGNQLAMAGQPRATAMDVWSGRADQGIASNGDLLRRLPDGSVERVSAQFGHRVIEPPQDTSGIPFSPPSGQAAQPQQMAQALAQQGQPAPMAQAQGQMPAPQGGGFLSNLFGGDERRQVNHTIQWLQQQGLDQGTAQALAQNPPLLQDYLRQRLRPQESSYGFMNVDGTLVRTNDATGEAMPIGRFGEPEQAPRPMTPAERQQWGIPEDDRRPYAMTEEGPKLIGGSGVTVNNNTDMRGETEYDKGIGKGYAERFLSIQNEAQTAQRAITSFKVMDQMMSRPGFYSGAGGEQVQFLKRIGSALGMDPDGIDSMETFNAMSKQAALDVMGGSLGTGFSNADRQFVIEQVPNLGNTPEGNRQLIGVQRKLAERKLQIAQIARRYAAQNDGRIDPRFDDALAQWAEQNPLFPQPPRQSEEQFLEQRYRQELNRPRAVNPDTGEVLEWDGEDWRPRGPRIRSTPGAVPPVRSQPGSPVRG